MVAILVKALLNTQKRLNIVEVDLVLLVLFATSSTYFIHKDPDYFNLASDYLQIVYTTCFSVSILCITVYFLLLQFYKFKSNRVDTLVCDLCLIFNLLAVVVYFHGLITYPFPVPGITVSQMIHIILYSAILVMGTGLILGIYSLVVLFLLLFSQLLTVGKSWLNK